MQMTMTTTNIAVLGIGWRHTADDIHLWMLGQSHYKLFSHAEQFIVERWVTELQFTDQHLRLGPLAQLDTHTHPCVNLSETNGVRRGECSAQAMATSACTHWVNGPASWLHSQFHTFIIIHRFQYLSKCQCTDEYFYIESSVLAIYLFVLLPRSRDTLFTPYLSVKFGFRARKGLAHSMNTGRRGELLANSLFSSKLDL